MIGDESDLERAIRERIEFEERFRVAVWSIALICVGLLTWVALR